MAHVLAHILSKNGCQNNTPYNANGEKIQYTFEWGKGTGQRVASGIFTFVHPANAVQRQYNKEALRLLEVKRCQLLPDQQTIGLGALPRMRFKASFLDFYGEYVLHNTLHCEKRSPLPMRK